MRYPTKAAVLYSKLNSKKIGPSGEILKLSWEHSLLLVCLDIEDGLDKPSISSVATFIGSKNEKIMNLLKDLVGANLISKDKNKYRRLNTQLIYDPHRHESDSSKHS